MLLEVLLALLLPPILLLAWVAVQNAWRRQFRSPGGDVDVLAGRVECGRCGCGSPCEPDDGPTESDTRRS